ncbi:MAG: hypothetical protein KF833_05235 [Verrucomicrobiae bacterium]|nr:hypothetical protein [Verrucomicrobiae bacterium]
MRDSHSRFYPPRAPWYAPAREAGHAVLSATRVRRIPTPGQMGAGRLLLGLGVPGYAFVVHGRPAIGWTLTAAFPALLLLGLAFLGGTAGNVILGLAISLHPISVVHLLSPWLRELPIHYRILGALAVVLGLLVFIWLPVQELTHRTLFAPIVTDQGFVVVRPTRNPGAVLRGTWIVHQTTTHAGGGVIVRAGTSIAPALALPGDTITFSASAVRVGTVAHPRQDGMPTEGSWTVPPDHWFVWPRLQVTVNTAGIDDTTIREIALRHALIPHENLRGVAFHRWFHRPQILTTP